MRRTTVLRLQPPDARGVGNPESLVNGETSEDRQLQNHAEARMARPATKCKLKAELNPRLSNVDYEHGTLITSMQVLCKSIIISLPPKTFFVFCSFRLRMKASLAGCSIKPFALISLFLNRCSPTVKVCSTAQTESGCCCWKWRKPTTKPVWWT